MPGSWCLKFRFVGFSPLGIEYWSVQVPAGMQDPLGVLV